jgi:hypothetical protein
LRHNLLTLFGIPIGILRIVQPIGRRVPQTIIGLTNNNRFRIAKALQTEAFALVVNARLAGETQGRKRKSPFRLLSKGRLPQAFKNKLDR